MRLFWAQFMLTLAALSWHAAIGVAHGPAPSALGIVAEGSTGPDLVRLTAGLARRASADEFRFVCPAAWGDELVLPAASVPSRGPVVIAGSRGLFLLDAAGVVTMHPDPLAATGPVTDFVVLGDKLFALRTVSGASELLEVDAARVRVLFSEPGSWSSIAATEDTIGIQRLREGKVEQLRLSAEGMLIGRDSAPAPKDPIMVLARATGRALYSLVATASGRELGQIDRDTWVRLELAAASIAGPVELPSGAPFIALDSELFRLPEPRVVLEGMPLVSCLGRLGDRAYACTRDGLAALEESGLGGAIFQLSSLLPPDVQSVPESQREACQLQWEHFRFDLLALGVTLAEPPAVTGSGGTAADASVAAAGAMASERPMTSPAADSGCSWRPAHTRTPLHAAWFALAIVLWLRGNRRRKR
jgi:hypothetical protein